MPKPKVVALAMRGPVQRPGLDALCAHADRLLEASGARVLECDLSALHVDAVAVDGLARLAAVAKRRRARLWLLGMPSELSELIALCGLDRVLCDRGDRGHAGIEGEGLEPEQEV